MHGSMLCWYSIHAAGWQLLCCCCWCLFGSDNSLQLVPDLRFSGPHVHTLPHTQPHTYVTPFTLEFQAMLLYS